MAGLGLKVDKKKRVIPDSRAKIKCPKCGADNPADALRCGRCGHPFVDPTKMFTRSEQ